MVDEAVKTGITVYIVVPGAQSLGIPVLAYFSTHTTGMNDLKKGAGAFMCQALFGLSAVPQQKRQPPAEGLPDRAMRPQQQAVCRFAVIIRGDSEFPSNYIGSQEADQVREKCLLGMNLQMTSNLSLMLEIERMNMIEKFFREC